MSAPAKATRGRRVRRALLCAVSATLAVASPAGAQQSGAAADPPAAANTPGNFDFYVLALSWSPSFCNNGGTAKGREQCAAGTKLGFVVHGLWPQNEHGWPRNCSSTQFATRAQIEAVHGLYPDDGLARHEWRLHGTCSGESPTAYFADVKKARQAITIPDAYAAPTAEQKTTPADVARAFIAANQGLRLDALAVTCRAGALEEVRICFSKDLRQFHTCPEVSRETCRAPEINVPPIH